MDRLAVFKSYSAHPWLKKPYSKLKADEIDLALQFIYDNNDLSCGDFEKKINRMFLHTKTPTKNWRIVMELLTCANSYIYQKLR